MNAAADRGRVLAIGAPATVQGFALVGVQVVPAGTPDRVRAAWARLPDDVALVILSPAARAALGDAAGPGGPLVAVLPP